MGANTFPPCNQPLPCNLRHFISFDLQTSYLWVLFCKTLTLTLRSLCKTPILTLRSLMLSRHMHRIWDHTLASFLSLVIGFALGEITKHNKQIILHKQIYIHQTYNYIHNKSRLNPLETTPQQSRHLISIAVNS